MFGTFDPPLDEFDKTIIFQSIKNKIIERALDSIKYIIFGCWAELRVHLIETFKDKTNSVTIANEILKLQNIKSPYKLLKIHFLNLNQG